MDLGTLALGGILGHVGSLLSHTLEPELSATTFRIVTGAGDGAKDVIAQKTKDAFAAEARKNKTAEREALFAFCSQQDALLNWARYATVGNFVDAAGTKDAQILLNRPDAPDSSQQRTRIQ